MRISRRSLLLGGVGGLALVAGLRTLTLDGPAPGARRLSSDELRLVEALAEALFPEGAFPVGGLEADVPRRVDRILADVLEESQATAFRYVLRTLDWGTAASRGARFVDLPVEARRDVLRTWREPEVMARRVAADSIKAILGMAYFSHPAVLGHIGWRLGCGGSA